MPLSKIQRARRCCGRKKKLGEAKARLIAAEKGGGLEAYRCPWRRRWHTGHPRGQTWPRRWFSVTPSI